MLSGSLITYVMVSIEAFLLVVRPEVIQSCSLPALCQGEADSKRTLAAHALLRLLYQCPRLYEEGFLPTHTSVGDLQTLR